MGNEANCENAKLNEKQPRSTSAAFSQSLYVSIFFGGQSPPG